MPFPSGLKDQAFCHSKKILKISKLVLETFDKLYSLYPDINVTFKSTMPVEKLANDKHSVVDNWKHFRDLNQMYNGRIQYSPTLEYTQVYNLRDEQIENIKHQLTKITKLELEFFDKFVVLTGRVACPQERALNNKVNKSNRNFIFFVLNCYARIVFINLNSLQR